LSYRSRSLPWLTGIILQESKIYASMSYFNAAL